MACVELFYCFTLGLLALISEMKDSNHKTEFNQGFSFSVEAEVLLVVCSFTGFSFTLWVSILALSAHWRRKIEIKRLGSRTIMEIPSFESFRDITQTNESFIDPIIAHKTRGCCNY